MVRSFGGLSNWTHSRVDRWRFLTKHSCFIRPRIVFRLEHFCRNALWREFYQVFTFSIARRRGLRNDTAIAVNCSESSNRGENVSTWCEFFAALSRIKICPVLLTLKNGNGEYYIYKGEKLEENMANFLSNKI